MKAKKWCKHHDPNHPMGRSVITKDRWHHGEWYNTAAVGFKFCPFCGIPKPTKMKAKREGK